MNGHAEVQEESYKTAGPISLLSEPGFMGLKERRIQRKRRQGIIMDKRGNMWTPEELLNNLGNVEGSEEVPRKHSPDEPRKMSLGEYLSSPEFQRKQKIASERAQQREYEAKMAFRSAQQQNPIKPRPRRKRGRKVR